MSERSEYELGKARAAAMSDEELARVYVVVRNAGLMSEPELHEAVLDAAQKYDNPNSVGRALGEAQNMAPFAQAYRDEAESREGVKAIVDELDRPGKEMLEKAEENLLRVRERFSEHERRQNEPMISFGIGVAVTGVILALSPFLFDDPVTRSLAIPGVFIAVGGVVLEMTSRHKKGTPSKAE